MALYDLKSLNKGSVAGLTWVMVNPLIRVASYVLIVSFIFQMRVSEGAGPMEYALYVLSGMIPWQILARALEESPSILRNRQSLIKSVPFPIEILPLANIIVSSLSSLFGLALLLVLLVVSDGAHMSVLFLPIPLFMFVVFAVGLSWVFSVLGVLLKDLREITSVVMGLLVYASPVIVSEHMVGETIWKLILFNPLSHVVICFRDVIYGSFHADSWIVFLAMVAASFLFGGYVITRARVRINEYL